MSVVVSSAGGAGTVQNKSVTPDTGTSTTAEQDAKGAPVIGTPDVEELTRFCTRIGMRAEAAEHWLEITERPRLYIALAFCGGAFLLAFTLVVFVFASPGQTVRHVLAYITTSLALLLYIGAWVYGPYCWSRVPAAKAIMLVVPIVSTGMLVLSLLSFGGGQIPFGSEIIFMLALTIYMQTSHVGNLCLMPADQTLLKGLSVLEMLWVATLRTIRAVDGVSGCAFAINTISRGHDCAKESPEGSGCASLQAMGYIAAAMAVGDMCLVVAVLLLGKQFQETKSARGRRALLILHCSSACFEAGMLCVHSVLGFSNVTPVKNSLNMKLFIAYSAASTILSLIGNIVGARRVIRLLQIVAASVPARSKFGSVTAGSTAGLRTCKPALAARQ